MGSTHTFCPRCGTRATPNGLFCPGCGGELTPSEAQQSAGPPSDHHTAEAPSAAANGHGAPTLTLPGAWELTSAGAHPPVGAPHETSAPHVPSEPVQADVPVAVSGSRARLAAACAGSASAACIVVVLAARAAGIW